MPLHHPPRQTFTPPAKCATATRGRWGTSESDSERERRSCYRLASIPLPLCSLSCALSSLSVPLSPPSHSPLSLFVCISGALRVATIGIFKEAVGQCGSRLLARRLVFHYPAFERVTFSPWFPHAAAVNTTTTTTKEATKTITTTIEENSGKRFFAALLLF